MSGKMILPTRPEEEELAKKLQELAELETELADRELHLASLRATLSAFDRRYLAIVGSRYATLDQIEAEIAELVARHDPSNQGFRDKAAEARKTATESQEAASTPESKGSKEFAPSPRLKELYREVAKRVHPDLTSDPAERNRRQRFMAEANLAYEQGDEAGLRRILTEYESSPEAVQGEGTAAELIRTIRKIAQVRSRIVEIETEAESLIQSDLHELMRKVEEAANQGHNLLDEMAEKLDAQIARARERRLQMFQS